MRKLLEKIYYKFNNYVYLFINNYQHKQNLISDIEYELRKAFLKEVEQFGVNDFYQNYPPLKISGKRCSLCRYKVYEMEDKLEKNFEVLDIGGNIGFFSLFLSRFVKSIDLVEQNNHLTDIGKRLAEYEKVDNVNILNEDFKIFESQKKYDLVMSLAIHRWVGLDFQEYFNRIHKFLKKGGLLLVESHVIYNKGGDRIESLLAKNKNYKIIEKGEIDDHDGKFREFFWLRRR